MRDEFIKAIAEGRTVKVNFFDVGETKYVIEIIANGDDLYFVKTKNGKIVECMNLTEKARVV